jgi:hypothetical protein
MSTVAQSHRPQRARRAPRNLPRTLFWLALPTLILLPLVWTSTFWHVPTWIAIELKVPRLAFTLNGTKPQEILNRSVPFSSLLLERCKSVAFDAETLKIANPEKLVLGTEAGSIPHYPDEAWSELKTKGRVTFPCHDSAAKLTLSHPDSATAQLGSLDRIYFRPGSLVVLAVSPGREPAFRVEIETPQILQLTTGPDLEIVADLAKPENVTVPFPGDLLTYRARMPEARRPIEVTSSEHGLDLTVTPPRNQTSQIFREPLDLPIGSVKLEEDVEGAPSSSLSDQATLTYPKYSTIKPVIIRAHDAMDLSGLSQAQLTSLDFDAKQGTFSARFIGVVRHATSRDGELTTDHRLTLFDTLRYSERWGLMAVAAVWLVSTTRAAFEVWKKLQE